MTVNKDMIVLPIVGIDDGKQPAGAVCAANEARFTAANFSEPLTTFAVGVKVPDIEKELQLVAPQVRVGRRFEYKSATNVQEFYSESDDIRAIGASFKRVEYAGTSVNQKTLNKGLMIRLDRDEDLVVPGAENLAVERLIRRLRLNDLRRAYAGLVAAATNSAKTWSTAALKDPDQDVLVDLDTGADARGIPSNVVAYGQTAWVYRSQSLRAQTVAGGIANAGLTPEQLAAWLGVDAVLVSKTRYQSTAAAKAKAIGGAYVLMFCASQMEDKDDPSNIKRFVTPTESGDFRVYREEHAKYVDVSVEHYSNIVITSTLGVRTVTPS
jgi:hypothetical protein